MEIRKLETLEEVKAFQQKLVVKVFGNFDQVINGEKDDCDKNVIWYPHYHDLFKPEAYLKDNRSIYELGEGYYVVQTQVFNKATFDIYRVVEK